LDLVLHQRIGENGGPGVFQYLGADGVNLNGRGQTTPGWFRGVPPDNLPDDDVPNPSFDFPFGRELVYQHSRPHRVTIEDALDFGQWVFKTTGADGARFDDVKGTWAPFVREFMTYGVMASKLFYSEYFDGNPATLDWWAMSDPMKGRSLVEDFTLHWALRAACNEGQARVLDGAGYTAVRPFLACTFVDNPDTDTSPGQQVINNKLLAYAFLLSIEGYPFVYGKDYFPASVWPGAYGLGHWIDNLIWIHEHLANGGTVTRYLDDKVIVLNRTGEPGLLTALNFDTLAERTISCATSFGPHVPLHDYSGRHPDIWTDSDGVATFTLPSNAFNRGQSYLCFSRAGLDRPNAVVARSTTQSIFCASDLDLPAVGNAPRRVGRFAAHAGTALNVTVRPNRTGWNAATFVELTVVDSAGRTVVDLVCRTDSTAAHAMIYTTGDHVVSAGGEQIPGHGATVEIEITYTAPQVI
jgi:alpha-amylase